MIELPEPKKIMCAGDWHGNSAWATHCVSYAQERGVDAILQVGDFGWWLPGLATTMYLRDLQDALAQAGIILAWIDGNHEHHPSIDEWVDATDGQPWSDKRYPNIVHLPRGFRWTWWGMKFLALGGAHSVDRGMRTEGASWWPREHISDAEVARAIDGGEVDVMITHDCPDGVDIPGIPSDPYEDTRGAWPMAELIASRNHRRKLATVVTAVTPALLVHGHYHLRYEARRNGTLIQGLDCDSTTVEGNTLILNRSKP